MKKFNFSNPWYLIIGLAVFKLIIHLITNTNYELHRDAYLYIAEAHHLDFGYLSIPPMLPVLIRIINIFLGDSAFVMRLLPAVIGAVSVIVVGKTVLEFGGKNWAVLIACVSFVTSPAFLRSNSLLQPVSINQFFWLISLYLVLKMIKARNTDYWAFLGIVWGLAFLNKYSIVFLALAVILGLLATKQRFLIQSPNFLIGMGFGALIILPNIYWQFSHNWPVIHHMIELARNQLIHVNYADFLMAQLFMNINSIFIWLTGFFFLLFSKEEKSYRVLGFTYIFLLLILIALHGKAYYTLGIYPFLFAAGGFFIEKHLTGRWTVVQKILVILIVLISLPVLPYSLPIFSFKGMADYANATVNIGIDGPMRWEDGQIHDLPQDYADMTGWKELAGIVESAFDSLNQNEKNKCGIFAENYGTAGAIRYYTKDSGLPEPVSFSDNFLFWAPNNIDIDVLIYVNDDTSDVSRFFAKINKVGQIEDPYAREKGTPVYLCRKPQQNFSSFYHEKVIALKSIYTD